MKQFGDKGVFWATGLLVVVLVFTGSAIGLSSVSANVANQLGAMTAAFLVGANIAFLLHLGRKLVVWFNLKITAAIGLLTYIGFGLEFSHPSLWRAVIGLLALGLDIAALFWMWNTIVRTAASGRTGLVPLWRDEDLHPPRP